MPALTESQKQAILSDSGSLLVSAAAGSGKTFTLTQRIIRLITEEGVSVDRLCVVTFTRAAAAELKERITKALTAAVLRADEENDMERAANLRRQLSLLPGARISTIDSYCYDFVKRNFDSIDSGSGLKIVDSAETAMLQEAVMDDVFDALSEDDGGIFEHFGGFGGFIDIFSRDSDDLARKKFIDLYENTVKACPSGLAVLDDAVRICLDAAEKGLKGSSWDKFIRKEIRETAEYYRNIWTDAVSDFQSSAGVGGHPYLSAFTNDLERINGLISAVENGEELIDIYRYISDSRTFTKLGRLKNDQSDRVTDFYKKTRDEYKEWIKDKKHDILAYDDKTLKYMLESTACIIEGTAGLLRVYSSAMEAEKKKRGIMDFSDIERLALDLLYEKGYKTFSETAAAESERYDEIFIDEYQDVNEIQDLIFRAVSCRSRRFMVGDIKQSIYGFRGAVPEIFARYRNSWMSGDSGEGRAVFMRENFRCAFNIISAANSICGPLLKNSGTGYLEGDDLVFASPAEHPEVPVKIRVFNPDNLKASDGAEAEDAGTDRQKQVMRLEAAYVAGEIKKLIESGSYLPSDIAILLRSAKNTAELFSGALSEAGIKSYNSAAGGFFDTPEIQLMRCLLVTIDNSCKDRYLVGAMRSPIYGFTVNDLVRIRCGVTPREKSGKKRGRSITFARSMREFIEKAKAGKDEKDKALAARCEKFSADIIKWREFSRIHPVYELIFNIYRETGLLSVGGGTSDEEKRLSTLRRANLMRLYDLAREYEDGSFKGLYSFIDYIEKSVDTSDERAADQGIADSVQIMTVHASKGLEFPVVFVCNTNKQFNRTDLSETLMMDAVAGDDNLGMSVKIPDPTNAVRFETPMYRAASLKKNSASVDEEIRMLYVALTRAKDRLYITGTMTESTAEEKLENCMIGGKYMSKALLKNQNCWIKWITSALGDTSRHSYIEYAFIRNMDEVISETGRIISSMENDMNREKNLSAAPSASENEEKFAKLFRKRFDFVYPYKHTVRLPAKLSVSRLFPGILDIEDNPGEYVDLEDPGLPAPVVMPEPEFITDSRSDNEATGAERGTATHVFMQFCDFGRVETDSPEAEAERLAKEGFITQRMASLIEYDRVRRFFRSDLYKAIRGSKMMKRELRFNALLPAAPFTNDREFARKLRGEEILVQGVIDCLFENDDGSLTLIDYKTDHFPGSTREEARARLLLRHSTQLGYYREALKRVSLKNVSKTLIYSFWLGETVEIPETAQNGI